MKRKTRSQREAEQRAALRQRITDVYSGALGTEWDEDQFATAEILSNVIPVLKEIFGDQVSGQEYLWAPHCLRYFDTAQSATDHLFSHGVKP